MALPRNEGKVKRCVRGRARKPSGSAHPGRGQHIALGGGGGGSLLRALLAAPEPAGPGPLRRAPAPERRAQPPGPEASGAPRRWPGGEQQPPGARTSGTRAGKAPPDAAGAGPGPQR